jgi:hypothetical protein
MRSVLLRLLHQDSRNCQPRPFLPLSPVLFAFFAVLLISADDGGLLRDPDTMWHIAVGNQILESGTFPCTDELSHTFAGQRWIAKAWLSQVILALAFAVRRGGGHRPNVLAHVC